MQETNKINCALIFQGLSLALTIRSTLSSQLVMSRMERVVSTGLAKFDLRADLHVHHHDTLRRFSSLKNDKG